MLVHLLCCKWWSLRYSPGWGNPLCCVVLPYVGERSEREQCCFLISFQALPPLPTSKLGPSCADLGGWDCVHSGTLWGSLMNSPVRLGVSPTTATPTGVTVRGFEALFPCDRTQGCGSVLLPSCSSQFICTQMWDHLVHQPPPFHESSLPWLPVSAPPTSFNEYFFFNSLVVRLPCSLIFWHFWLFFVFKFVVVLLVVVRGGKAYLPMPPSWPEVQKTKTLTS